MRRLGVVENIAHDGTVLIRSEFAPSRGADVRDKRSRPLGRVVKVFGPVQEPFAAVRPVGPASLPLSEPTASSMRGTMPTKKIEEAGGVTRCPECNSGHLSFDYERGELICEECGLVLTDQMIDQGPEWRAVDGEQGGKRARTRAPLTDTIPHKGPSAASGWEKKNSYWETDPTPDRAPPYR